MPGNLAALTARNVGRPLLLTPQAALDLAQRLQSVDPRAAGLAARARPGMLGRIFSLLSAPRAEGAPAMPMAMEDDDYVPVPLQTRLAYSPLYAGEPEDVGFCWTLCDGVALMQCDTALLDRGEEYCGVVYHGYDTLLAGMRTAAQDPRVRAVFLRLATPGGVVAGGLPQLAAYMRGVREAAGGKPIWVYADMACSAGYWIASQADRILSPRVGLVGSIGAVLLHENYAGALKEFGLEITSIQFGKQKTAGAWWAALDPVARADLQAEIDQCGRDFVADLVAGGAPLGRIDAEAALASEAAVYLANHDEDARSGIALKLVDAIAHEEDAFAELVDHVRLPNGASNSSAPAIPGSSGAAATGARGASQPAKEQPMAGKAPTQQGRIAALASAQAVLATAQAEVTRLTAASAAAPAEDDPEDAIDGGADEDTEDAEGNPKPQAGVASSAAPESEAVRIAKSPAAEAEPELARAAIASGQTLGQFEATVAAVAGRSAGVGALGRVMNGAERLGPDGAKAQSGPARISVKDIYSRRKAGSRAAG